MTSILVIYSILEFLFSLLYDIIAFNIIIYKYYIIVGPSYSRKSNILDVLVFVLLKLNERRCILSFKKLYYLNCGSIL